jgi:uncharacterized membrane protein YphA (DoxX/SURF4 family)
MDTAITVAQVILGLGILNVWLLRFGKATAWRGGDAKNLKEEFAVYGLPPWFMALVGVLKVGCAGALLAGIWFPALTRPAALGLGVLMLGAVAMHVKVGDPMKKSLPAFTILVLCAFVAATG